MQPIHSLERFIKAGALIALALILSAYLITSILKIVMLNQGKITVKGYAEKKISSDFVTWHGELTTRAAILSDAYDKLEKNQILVLSYLEKGGIKNEELQISSVNTSIHYKQNVQGAPTNEIEGFSLRQEFNIQSTDIAVVSKVATQITHLIKEGIEISSHKPQYFYTKIDELKIHMLGEAAKDALARAHQLATNSGSQVGPLKGAQQGVFQITPAFSTSVSDYGENDSSTIEKSIKAVITMEYGVK